jgi:hypothetical protein
MLNGYNDVLDTILKISKMFISSSEKKALLETTKECFATYDGERDIFDKYIKMYEERIEEERKRAEMLRSPFSTIQAVPC